MPRYQVWYGERIPITIETKDVASLRKKLLKEYLHLAKKNGIGLAVTVKGKRIGELLYGEFSGYEPSDIPLWRTVGNRMYYILKDGTLYR